MFQVALSILVLIIKYSGAAALGLAIYDRIKKVFVNTVIVKSSLVFLSNNKNTDYLCVSIKNRTDRQINLKDNYVSIATKNGPGAIILKDAFGTDIIKTIVHPHTEHCIYLGLDYCERSLERLKDAKPHITITDQIDNKYIEKRVFSKSIIVPSTHNSLK